MFQYRQVLVRLRQGDTDRDIARSGLMGRPKVKELREVAGREGWLAPEAPLPEDEAIVQALGAARRASSTISSVEPFRELVSRWVSQGVSGVAIHAALKREHGYTGSYSSVYRMLSAIRAALRPDVTVPLTFAPAEAAQVDFGAGPVLFDVAEARARRTWCFVMTLCFSRHQYVEFVWDRPWPPGSAVTAGRSSGLALSPSGSSSITPSARSPGRASTIRWFSVRMPRRPRATAFGSTPVRRPIRRRRASSKRASST